jgi:hypothetical protein
MIELYLYYPSGPSRPNLGQIFYFSFIVLEGFGENFCLRLHVCVHNFQIYAEELWVEEDV